MFKVTFYKNYPFARGGDDAGRVTAPAFLTEAQRDNFLSIYMHGQPIENDGDFFEEQGAIYVDDFDAVDGCNYARVQVDNKYNYFFFVEDIVCIPSTDNTPAARVTLTEDILQNDFYTPDGAGGFTLPTVTGIPLQTTEKGTGGIKMPPEELYFKTATITADTPYNAASDWAIVVACVDASGIIYMLIPDFGSISPAAVSAYVAQVAKLSKLRLTEINGEAVPPTDSNISILNIYAIPKKWISAIMSDTLQIIAGEEAGGAIVECKYVGVYQSDDTVNCQFFSALKISQCSGRILADTLTAPEWNGEKVTLKTATQEIEMTGICGGQSYALIYLSVAPLGSDTLTIMAAVNNSLYDISADFAADFAVNEAALNIAQHKSATIMRTVTTAIAGVGGVVGGIASGNYFGAIQSAAGTVENLTSIYENTKNPATVTNAGSAVNAIATFGGIAFYRYTGAVNQPTVLQEAKERGFLIKTSVYQTVVWALPTAANEYFYICYKNVKVLGSFGNASSKAIGDIISRGLSLQYINAPTG